jgi:hypothetical protein
VNPSILIQLPTDPTCWGSTKYEADPDNLSDILDRMESMICSEFEGRFDLDFERTQTPRGCGVHSENKSAQDEVWEWIGDHWTHAL